MEWMMAHSRITRTYSVRDGEEILREKGLLDEVHDVTEEIAETAGTDTAAKRVMDDSGWETDHTISVGRNRPRLDGFKSGVGVEYETGEQMRVRSHLLFGAAMYRQEEIDVWICIIPTENDASVRRTANEFGYALFTEYFPLKIPAYLIECELVDG